MDSAIEFSAWARYVMPLLDDITPAAAKKILRMKFRKKDLSRIKRLSELASEGELSDTQRAELQAFHRLGSVLGIMHSKARVALKRGQHAGRRKSA